jgi:hypothetical protein
MSNADEQASVDPSSDPKPANQSSRYADATLLRSAFPSAIQEVVEALGEVTIVARREGLLELLGFLKHDAQFSFTT